MPAITIIGTILTAAPKGGAEAGPSGLEQCVIQGIATISAEQPPIQPPSPGEPTPPDRPRPTPPVAGWPSVPGFTPGSPGGPGIPGEPPEKPPEPIQPPIDWKAVWTPNDGWVVVGIPNVPHPTPSGSTQAPASGAQPPKK